MQNTLTRMFALSGPDNVGKTSQLRWLTYSCPTLKVLGRLNEYYPNWNAVVETPNWWFKTSSHEDHVNTIFDAFRYRQRHATSGDFFGLDRGPRMMVAVCAATKSVKDGSSVEDCLAYVEERSRAREMYIAIPEILLMPSMDPNQCADNALSRELNGYDPIYAQYQKLLAQALIAQANRGLYTHVLPVGGASIAGVTNRIIELLRPLCAATMSELFTNIHRAIVIGGMSESGKSTVAEIVRERFGYTRLKIGYLAETAAERLRVSISEFYKMPTVAIAEEMLISLDRFASNHYYLKNYTLESAHRYDVAEHWKRVIGDKLSVLFVDTDELLRARRAEFAKEELDRRDKEKLERGADQIKSLADIVVGNDGSLRELEQQLARALRVSLAVNHAKCGTDQEAVETLKNAFAAHAPAELRFACLTGSLSYGEWEPSESDIDLLLVVDFFNRTAFKNLATSLKKMFPKTKLGMTIILEAELYHARLPGVLLHGLARLRDGSAIVLYENNGRYPVFTEEEENSSSSADLLTALGMLRRALVLETIPARQVTKYAGLVSKVLLRESGIVIESELEALAKTLEGERISPEVLRANISDAKRGDLKKALALAGALIAIYQDQWHSRFSSN